MLIDLSKVTQTCTNIKNKEDGGKSWENWKKDPRNQVVWVILYT